MSHDPLPAHATTTEIEAALPARSRHDGWTPARQQEFVECLADGATVQAAARRVGMTVQSAYRLRRHPDARDFRAAWDLALQEVWHQVKRVALDRVIHGEEVEIIRDGVVVAVKRKPCDPKFLLAMLDRVDSRLDTPDRQYTRLSDLRTMIDDLPDREHWVGERLDPLHFRELERLPRVPREPPPPPPAPPKPTPITFYSGRANAKNR